jgi:hypothetical protein
VFLTSFGIKPVFVVQLGGNYKYKISFVLRESLGEKNVPLILEKFN